MIICRPIFDLAGGGFSVEILLCWGEGGVPSLHWQVDDGLRIHRTWRRASELVYPARRKEHLQQLRKTGRHTPSPCSLNQLPSSLFVFELSRLGFESCLHRPGTEVGLSGIVRCFAGRQNRRQPRLDFLLYLLVCGGVKGIPGTAWRLRGDREPGRTNGRGESRLGLSAHPGSTVIFGTRNCAQHDCVDSRAVSQQRRNVRRAKQQVHAMPSSGIVLHRVQPPRLPFVAKAGGLDGSRTRCQQNSPHIREWSVCSGYSPCARTFLLCLDKILKSSCISRRS